MRHCSDPDLMNALLFNMSEGGLFVSCCWRNDSIPDCCCIIVFLRLSMF